MRVLLLILLVGATLLKVAVTEEAKVEAKDGEEEVQVIQVEVQRPERVVNKREEKELTEEEIQASMRQEEGEVPVIMTSTGKVSGIRERSYEGKVFFSYYSIPYAKPPVGELRFKDPQMLSGWDGVRDGSKLPPACPQVPTSEAFSGGQDVQGDEDCLYLNIFTPKPMDTRPHLPVMVYIHGGGYLCGSTSEYPPYALLNEDVVLVTVQYRLGILGFLSTEDDVVPGNMGLKDQTLALSWVQRNVNKFGGDPLHITLFGESAGAASVHFQILTPKSIGMFKRAILQSGNALCPWAMGAKHAEVAEYTGRVFNCSAEEGSEQLIKCLQGVDALELASVINHIPEWIHFPLLLGPRVDGQYLPAHPNFLMKEGRHKRVDLMTGITQDDGGFFTLMMYANEMTRSSMASDFVRKGPFSLEFRPEDVAPLNQTVLIYDHYLGGLHFDAQHAEGVTRMFSDRHFLVPHDLTSQLYSKSVAPFKNSTYRYEFKYKGKRTFTDFFGLDIGRHWIPHLDDLYYLFEGGPVFKKLEDENDLKMRKIMLKLWTNFAATGNPTPDDSLGFKWDVMTGGSMRYLALQLEPKMEDDQREKVRDFWYSLPLAQNLYLHPERVPNLVYVPVEEDTAEDTTQAPTDKDTPTTAPPVENILAEPPKDTDKHKDEL